jgi:hypothetical protein
MIGKYIIMGGKGYLSINRGGTLYKLPKLKWWWEVWFLIVSYFRDVHINEIKRIVRT